MAGILYLVATPIGNLGDLSPRAVETLAQADFIAAEDTRVSLRLLTHFDIRKPLVSYHEHNRAAAGPAIAERLQGGESCALVTDAVTPAISDPGEDLVRLCGQEGITVQAIPGCCAAVCALAVSGRTRGASASRDFCPPTKRSAAPGWRSCPMRSGPWCSTRLPTSCGPPWRICWRCWGTGPWPCAGS